MPSKASEVVKRIQHELARRGFNPGAVDGIFGPNTRAAVKRFQASAGLLIDGIVGPKTQAALLSAVPAPAPADDPGIPWFQEARRLLGVRETPGTASTVTIIDWARDADIPYRSDDIPWCGLFTAHCIASTLSEEALPANPLGARNWLRFGAPCERQLGAVLVFWRDRIGGFKGHVGFYAGEDADAYHVLGGNQSDRVSITRIAKSRLLGSRWPATAPVGDGERLLLVTGDTFFSTNEA